MTNNPNTPNTKKPNFGLRRAVAAGLATAAVAGIVEGPKVVNRIQLNNTVEDIRSSGDHAEADFNDGKFKGEPVVKVIASQNQSTFGAAAALTPKGENILDTESVIQAETGDVVDGGEALILPEKLVKDEFKQPNPLPDDPNTHVQ